MTPAMFGWRKNDGAEGETGGLSSDRRTRVFLLISQQRKQHGRLRPAPATLTTSKQTANVCVFIVSCSFGGCRGRGLCFSFQLFHKFKVKTRLLSLLCVEMSCGFSSVRSKQSIFPWRAVMSSSSFLFTVSNGFERVFRFSSSRGCFCRSFSSAADMFLLSGSDCTNPHVKHILRPPQTAGLKDAASTLTFMAVLCEEIDKMSMNEREREAFCQATGPVRCWTSTVQI